MTGPTIVMPTDALATSEASDATNAMIDLVNTLRDQLWKEAEIPEPLWALYYADYYVCQVLNGGHSQFFDNAARFGRANVIRRAQAGLACVGATEEARALEGALALVATHPELVERRDDEAYWDAASDVSPSFFDVDRSFESVHEETGWFERCRAWLRTSADVERLERVVYEHRLEALARAVPDHAARVIEAEDARIAAMPAWQRKVRELCFARDLGEPKLNAGRPMEDGSVVWSFTAGDRRREAVVDRDGSLLETRFDLPEDPREARAREFAARMQAKKREG